MTKQRKAISLISGGLDSLLATKAILEQGIHVEGINFFTGFCVEGHTHAIRKKDQSKNKRNNALWVAETLGIKLHIIDVVEEYKPVLLNPKHGYGQHLNPCLDCKVFMVKKAHEWIKENDFDFIITGEVLGQRPMSQRKDTMPLIAKHSGADDRVLRPLCAKNLKPTLPELEGWVDREKLYAFSGRSRKPQMRLAEQYNLKEYAQPAGGCCFLTNKSYSNKLKDLWQGRSSREYDLDDILLLKVGRHIRPNENFKIIIGREEGENKYLEGYRYMFTSMHATSHNGPLALIDGNPTEQDMNLAAKILARYTQATTQEQVHIEQKAPDGTLKQVVVTPLSKEDVKEDWVID